MKIEFEPATSDAALVFEMPRPASMSIPRWYKDMPIHMDGEKETGLSDDTILTSNLTLKGCTPFLDALVSGYMFVLPFDLEIRNHRGKGLQIRWAVNDINMIQSHSPDQVPGIPSPYSGMDGVFKWSSGWRMITPRGYSVLYTHPLNRNDLPFRTFSGIVDTDNYPLSVDFPFQFLDKFEKDINIIEKGTPICQAIPFKRDSFVSEFKEFDARENKKNIVKLKSKIVRSYKNQFWSRKEYR